MMCVSKEDAAMSIFVEQPSHCYPSHRVLCPSRRQYEVAIQSLRDLTTLHGGS